MAIDEETKGLGNVKQEAIINELKQQLKKVTKI
jgi:hypothetical protein